MKKNDKNIVKTSRCSEKKEVNKCAVCKNSTHGCNKKNSVEESLLYDKIEEENTISFMKGISL